MYIILAFAAFLCHVTRYFFIMAFSDN